MENAQARYLGKPFWTQLLVEEYYLPLEICQFQNSIISILISCPIHRLQAMKHSRLVKHSQYPTETPVTVEDTTQHHLEPGLFQKFIAYMNQLRKNRLREGVKNIYGRHYAVNFNPTYTFQEQWESKKKQFEQNNYYEIIQSENLFGYIYTVLYLLFEIFLFWYYTTFRLIGFIQEQQTLNILLVSLIATVVDSAIKFFLKFIKTGAIIEVREVFVTFLEPIILLVYYSFNFILVSLQIYEESNVLMYVVDLIAIRLLYKRAKSLFRHFKIRSYTTAYKHYFKILDLVSNILIIEHTFALLIFLVSLYDANNNWLNHYGHSDASNLQRYYYSFYFTSTTIFTIGYGDIIPINNLEIFCVLVMQMLGIANFSYLINEIGYTLSTIRKEEEELENNISTLSKMCKYYRIDQDLANLAKEYLVNNKKSFEDIEPEEESKVLMKLNDDLRDTLTYQNSVNIIKTSLFFICHWTKNFQTEIAKKLVKKILIPNENIIQNLGKERIYIIKSGKLEIYTDNSHGLRKNFKKLLKTIEPKSNTGISDNVYGYTTVISNKPLKFNAISKDFTCVYSIDKNNFMDCVHENKLDSEYYFEIKANLDTTKYIEGYQAPAILNIRQHYRPSETFLIKKHVRRMNKFSNSRRYYLRYDRNPSISNTKMFTNNKEDELERTATKEICLTSYHHENTYQNRGSLNESSNFTTMKEESTGPNKQILIVSHFQAMKEYQKYFKRFNITSVLSKFDRQNYFNSAYVDETPSGPFWSNKVDQ